MTQTRENPLSGIEPSEVMRSYDSLGLADWSDFELLRAAASIVSEPKLEFSSFAMHAPLELLARFCLLPLVAPKDRRLARIQIVATTAVYRSDGPAVEQPRVEALDVGFPSAIIPSLRQAISEGNVQRSDQLFTALGERFDPLTVLGSVADLSLRTVTGGAHTHIGLMLLARIWAEAVPEILKLPRAGVRYMAAAPDLNLKPTTGPGRLGELLEALARVPRLASVGVGIQGMVQTSEEEGLVEAVLGDGFTAGSAPVDWEDAIRTACRVAALSMLADSREAAKYIWTHCLTLPQAAWGLARVLRDPSFRMQAARSAVTWVISFRAAAGNGHLDTRPEIKPVKMDMTEALYDSPEAAASVAWHAEPGERDRLIRVVATEAAIRIDAHLIKHTRACLDLALMDSEQARLYYAAAAYLCSLWCTEEPREVIAQRLAARPGLDVR